MMSLFEKVLDALNFIETSTEGACARLLVGDMHRRKDTDPGGTSSEDG